MDLSFEKKGNLMVAEFEATGPFNLHVERDSKGYIAVYQKGIAEGEYSKEQQAWIRTQVQKIMPAHQQVHVIFNGPSWDEIDSRDNSFLSMDNRDMTWEEIDNLD